MPLEPAGATPSAYAYPLLVKQLLHSARATAGGQEIVYRDRQRHSYRQFFERLPGWPTRWPGSASGRAARWR
jgi:fatty-acyl-CoA synthase